MSLKTTIPPSSHPKTSFIHKFFFVMILACASLDTRPRYCGMYIVKMYRDYAYPYYPITSIFSIDVHSGQKRRCLRLASSWEKGLVDYWGEQLYPVREKEVPLDRAPNWEPDSWGLREEEISRGLIYRFVLLEIASFYSR
ncbi:MAG: hypothetical protein AAF696_09620 [Bacteroidota bacterium]